MRDITLRTCLQFVCLAGALPLLSGCAASGGSLVAEFDLDPCSDAIYVPVTCRGVEHLFLLDTGASLCVFDRSMREQLGEPIGRHYAGTMSGVEAIELYPAPPLVIGSALLDPDEQVICEDLLTAQVSLDRRISGILGMSFLEDYALELDVDGGKARILESPVPNRVGKGQKLRLDVAPHDGPELAVDIGDTSQWVPTLDTGCSFFGGMDHVRCERALGEGLMREGGRIGTATPHRVVTAEVVVLDSLVVGPFSHAGVGLSRGESSVLGLPFLYGYNTVMDFPERTICLERRFDGASSGYDNALDLAVYGSGSGLVVSAVAPGGASETSGLVPGDVILEMEGEFVGGMRLACAQERLRCAQTDSVELLIDRDGDRLPVEVRLDGVTREPLADGPGPSEESGESRSGIQAPERGAETGSGEEGGLR